jgi:hypothetical protein
MKITGFYRCKNCNKLHTFCAGFSIVHCSCGAEINQWVESGVHSRAVLHK